MAEESAMRNVILLVASGAQLLVGLYLLLFPFLLESVLRPPRRGYDVKRESTRALLKSA